MSVPKDLRSYSLVLVTFGFSFGIIFGVVAAVGQLIEGQVIGAVAVILLSPIFLAIFHGIVSVVTFPIYKFVVMRIFGYSET